MSRNIPKEVFDMSHSNQSRYSIWLNLTIAASIVFLFCVLLGDIFGLPFCEYTWGDHLISYGYVSAIPFLASEKARFYVFLACFYLSTALTYPIIFAVIGLVRNIKKDKIFDKANTRLMTMIALCCFLICVVCTIGAIACYMLCVIAMIGLFVGLIVQCVQMVMDRAIDMRNELDLTV